MTDLEKCDREIEAIEGLLRSGHHDVEGLCLALADWSAERRILTSATEDQSRSRVIEILEGRPGHRPLNRKEPTPRVRAPRCPDYLDEAGKKEWRRLVPILMRMKVLTEADGLTLASLCQACSTMVKATTKLNETGILYKSPSGYVMQSPVLPIVNQCIDTITKISREFGLTPATRSRIIAQTDDASMFDLEDFVA